VAAAARRRPRQDHGIAGRESVDAGTDVLDHAGALVTQHDGDRDALPGAVGGVQAGVADAAGGHPYEHLSPPGRLELQIFHAERLALLVEHRGLHGISL
jgi:hypothetical protein